MPRLIDFYEDHQRHRDRFEILAFHDGSVKDFAELDSKLPLIIRGMWLGRKLPFPVLLDSTGTTLKKFGVTGFPTMLLIDPEGKLVGRASEQDLEKKLPPVPPAERLARALDRLVVLSVNDTPLEEAVKGLARSARVEIRLDAEGLKKAGVPPDTRVPLRMSGYVTLRSAFNLLLDPYELTYVRGKDSLVIRRKPPGGPGPKELSSAQKDAAARIEETLGKKVTFDFKGATLEEVVGTFARLSHNGKFNEDFVLDPKARKAGKLDPKARVSGSGRDVSIRQGLGKLLKPLGLTVAVRDEVVVVTVAPGAGGEKRRASPGAPER